MSRFDNVFPLAVASYNAGPFNVSSWLGGTGADMPIDEWVEHIPLKETREYVQKVTAGYAAYIQLYGPSGAGIALPPSPKGDHPEIVDF
jgi:soluble lytic murein transglycosylase